MQLGMAGGQLDSIQSDNKDPELRKRAMLRDWLSHTPRPCWSKLIDALQSLGEVELAKKISLSNDVELSE